MLTREPRGAASRSFRHMLNWSHRPLFGGPTRLPCGGFGSAAPVRDFRMQPFTRDLDTVVGCHPRATTVVGLGLPRRGRRTSSSEVDLPFVEKAAKVSFRQPASFGSPKSNDCCQSSAVIQPPARMTAPGRRPKINDRFAARRAAWRAPQMRGCLDPAPAKPMDRRFPPTQSGRSAAPMPRQHPSVHGVVRSTPMSASRRSVR